ncbi:hypothetical protein NNC19_14505 [Clostridium sp. SHJSY1]|uniref:hypothetical protein n=1 Tax=Clostridium sp. SHJSY1 TaxID=2942483 RepID=UPI002876CB7E|nr:hypothetical protein [Clostridium sp. SHJSY1]MDS0526900.1 hypothetical protein [Clostridium sp. SHJSY1]
MNRITTKYGVLNGVATIGKYNSGEYEYFILNEKSELNISGNKFIPLYEEVKERRKELPSVRFYKNGNIKSLALNEQITVNTDVGDFSAEKIVFYEDGKIKRLFPLDGKLSAYWTEEDEYKLANKYIIHTRKVDFSSKIISLFFFKSGKIKSVTLWSKERIKLKIKDELINIRIGLSFYEDGEISSCEPAIPTPIKTPIGIIDAFDKSAIGIHGEDNSLKFNENGSIKSLITSTNKIEVTNREGEKEIYSSKTIKKYVGDINTTVPVCIEFFENDIKINEDKYKINENSFEIYTLVGKTLTLKGDL